MATYARADAVDIRIWTHARQAPIAAALRMRRGGRRRERRIVDAARRATSGRAARPPGPRRSRAALDARGWRLVDRRDRAAGRPRAPARRGPRRAARVRRVAAGSDPRRTTASAPRSSTSRSASASWAGARSGSPSEARERGGDTAVTVAIVDPRGQPPRDARRLPCRPARPRPRGHRDRRDPRSGTFAGAAAPRETTP